MNTLVSKVRRLLATRYSLLANKRGFTILELIIYIVIFAIVSSLGAAVFNFATKAKLSIGKLSEVQISTTRVFSQMVEKVHGSLTINDASTTLNLAMSSSSQNPTIFSLTNGALMIKEGSGAAVSTTPSTIFITSLSFTKVVNPAPSTSTVQIKITAGYNNSGTADQATLYSLQTTVMPL